MELYILNKAYYKKNSPTTTLHSSTVFVTTNRDRVVEQLNHEHNKMLQYFSDIFEEPENLISTSQHNMQMHPKAPTGYSYEGQTVIAFLTISVVSTASIPDKEPLKPRDIVKFKEDAEAYFASHRSDYGQFVGAKTALIRDVGDTTAVVEILQSSSTGYLDRVYNIPLDYLTKVTV
jgi:hypothetical protein